MSYSTNTLRLSGHSYCRCASFDLTSFIHLECSEPKSQSNISMEHIL